MYIWSHSYIYAFTYPFVYIHTPVCESSSTYTYHIYLCIYVCYIRKYIFFLEHIKRINHRQKQEQNSRMEKNWLVGLESILHWFLLVKKPQLSSRSCHSRCKSPSANEYHDVGCSRYSFSAFLMTKGVSGAIVFHSIGKVVMYWSLIQRRMKIKDGG